MTKPPLRERHPMKRAGSACGHPPPSLAQAMPDTARPNENAQHNAQATGKKTTHYLPADVLERTLVLASERERASGTPTVKLRMSGVPAMNDEPVGFFNLPSEVLAQIARKLDRTAANALALTGPPGYRCKNSAQLMRHLPGLLSDLKRMDVGTMKILPASLSVFLQAISVAATTIAYCSPHCRRRNDALSVSLWLHGPNPGFTGRARPNWVQRTELSLKRIMTRILQTAWKRCCIYSWG